MKNKKVAAFAVLSVLALGIGGVATISSSFNSYASLVEAEEAAACSLVWDKRNAPNLDAQGAGTSLAGVTEIAYKNAANVAGKHVGLKPGGSITQSGKAWDGKTGGKINGITAVTVWFTSTVKDITYFSEMNEEYGLDPYVTEPGATLYLRTYFNGEQSSSNTKIQSGVRIDLSSKSLSANEFIIDASKNSNATGTVDGMFEIEKIQIECSMEEKFGLSVNAPEGVKLEVYPIDPALSRGNKIDRLSDVNFSAQELVGIKLPESSKDTLDSSNITVSNASFLNTIKFNGEKQDTLVYRILGNATITVNKVTPGAPYEGRAFVGTYTLINPVDFKSVTMDLNADATFTFNGQKGTYVADDADKITLSGVSKITGFETFEDGLVKVKYNEYKYSAYYFYGYAGESTTVNIKSKKSGTGYGYWGTVSSGAKSAEIFTEDNDTFVLNENMKVTPTNSDLTTAKRLVLTETRPLATANDQFAMGNTSFKTYFSETADSKVATAYFKLSHSGAEYEDTKIDDRIFGTFTCEGKPTLTLDGFGGYTLGTESGDYDKFGWTTNIVTIKGVDYQLDKVNGTYKELVKIVNFLADGETRNYKSADGLIDVTFNGTSITDNIINATKAYEYDDVKGEIKVSLEKNSGYAGKGRNYTFVLGQNADTLTLTRAQKYTTYEDPDWGWQSNNDEEDIGILPMTITLQKAEPSPFATKVTYSNGSKTFVFENGTVMVNDGSSWDKPSRAEKFTYDGTKVTFSKFYHEADPFGDPMSALYSQSVTFTFTLSADFTTLTLDADIVLDPIDAMTAKTLYSAGFTLTKVA